MKRFASLSSALLFVGSIVAVQAGPADDVNAAAKKLEAAGGYAWKSTVESAGGGGGGRGGRGGGPTEGKIGKDGIVQLSMTRGQNTTEAFLNKDKGAAKTQEGWQSLAELREAGAGGGGGGGGRGGFLARSLQNYKAPAAEAADLVAKSRNLTASDGAITGELTPEGAKSLLVPGRGRAGGNGPDVSNGKGTVKFWVKDGVLTKYQYHVQGSVSFNNNDREIDRTTTVEIKDVGATSVQVPEEAKKKLS
jgi:hypothetical protein